LVRENIKEKDRFAAILHWIGEVERFCSGLVAMREA